MLLGGGLLAAAVGAGRAPQAATGEKEKEARAERLREAFAQDVAEEISN